MKPHIHKDPEKLQSECTLEKKEKKFFSKHRHSKTSLWKIDFLEPTLMRVSLFGVGEWSVHGHRDTHWSLGQ